MNLADQNQSRNVSGGNRESPKRGTLNALGWFPRFFICNVYDCNACAFAKCYGTRTSQIDEFSVRMLPLFHYGQLFRCYILLSCIVYILKYVMSCSVFQDVVNIIRNIHCTSLLGFHRVVGTHFTSCFHVETESLSSWTCLNVTLLPCFVGCFERLCVLTFRSVFCIINLGRSVFFSANGL